MYSVCPYDCENKTELGYCKTTACINPAFNQKMYNFDYNNFNYVNYQSPCMNCSNNPVNGGSGICHCILGNLVIYS